MEETNNNSNIETLESQDTELIKQQGWSLTQIFSLDDGDEEEIQRKALDFAKKLSTKFDVALHKIEDIEFRILEVYIK